MNGRRSIKYEYTPPAQAQMRTIKKKPSIDTVDKDYFRENISVTTQG